MDISLNPIIFALLMIGVGMTALAVPLLWFSRLPLSVRVPLVTFLLAGTLAISLPAAIELLPALEFYALGIVLPCFMLLPIALSFYVDAITSATPWRWQRKHIRHAIPIVLAFVGSVNLWVLPKNDLLLIFSDNSDNLRLWPQVVVIYAFINMVGWVFLSGYFVIRMLRRLIIYRRSLKQLFANNDQRELYWLSALVSVLALTWLLSLMYSIPLLTSQALPLPVEILVVMYIVLLWILCVFGSRQQPGFSERYLPDSATTLVDVAKEPVEKYRKSGLGDTQMQRIATKIESAMRDQQLFLDPGLSLPGLASTLQISPNYISQTLNETLQQTFFDYVNGWRIRYAIPAIIAAEKSILDIAMDSGFNARSSFYKAFKAHTGLTPTQYRQKSEGVSGQDMDEIKFL